MATEEEKLSDADKAFLSFDFEANEKWRLYLSNLFPTPTNLLIWRKKWYKANIDSTFDVTTSVGLDKYPPTPAPPPTKPSAPPAASPSSPSATADPQRQSQPPTTAASGSAVQSNISKLRLTAALRSSALLLSILCCIPMFPRRAFNIAVWLHIAANASAIVAKFGFPKFDAQWAQPVMTDDSALSLFFSMIAFSLNGNVLALISPCITSVLGLAESYATVIQPYINPSLDQKVQLSQGARTVNMRRYQLMQFRANAELLLGLVTTALIFFGKSAPLTVGLYWNALRSAYQVSGFTRTSFGRLNATISGFLSNSFLPPAILNSYAKLADYLHNFSVPPPA